RRLLRLHHREQVKEQVHQHERRDADGRETDHRQHDRPCPDVALLVTERHVRRRPYRLGMAERVLAHASLGIAGSFNGSTGRVFSCDTKNHIHTPPMAAAAAGSNQWMVKPSGATAGRSSQKRSTKRATISTSATTATARAWRLMSRDSNTRNGITKCTSTST